MECNTAAFNYTFENGYVVTLNGPLRAHLQLEPNLQSGDPNIQPPPPSHTLKFNHMEFSSRQITKYISLDAIKSGPTNDMGIMDHSTPLGNGMNGVINGISGGMSNGINSATQTPLQQHAVPPGQQLSPMSGGGSGRTILERVSIPLEPVNAFGIPQATMRTLEVSCRFYILLLDELDTNGVDL